MTDTDPTPLQERIARALDKNFNPDRYPIMVAMFMDYAAAVLPIVEAEVRAAKAEALRSAAEWMNDDLDYGYLMGKAHEYETGDQA